MARKHRPEISFGSGSFLDVLCNMVGILIILIAVVGMRVADKDDPVIEMESPAPPPATVDPAIDARRIERESLLAAHRQALIDHENETGRRQAEWQRLLAEMQDRNQQINQQAAALRQQINSDAQAIEQEEGKRLKLATMIAAAADQDADLHQNETEFQKQAVELMKQRKELQTEIDAQKVAQAIRKPVFEIEAHDGNSGTNRRPILIECRSDGLEFASEKVAISARALNEFGPDHNPLLAGAEALVTYWTLADAQQAGAKKKPYVLLIVRPGGTVGFYVARRYLESLNQDYGYELVPDSADIKWPPADPQAVEVCRTAVERAMHESHPASRKSPSGLAGRGGSSREPVRGANSERGGTGSETGGKNGRGEPIVGSNGEFELPEVEQLKNSSPRDSIGMLGPEWSPQRQRLAAGRPGAAGETVQNGFPESQQDQPGERGGRGVPATDSEQRGGDSKDFTEQASAANASANGATRSGFNLKPYADQHNSRGMPDSAENTGASSSQGGQTGGRPANRKPDMPVSPLMEKQEGMPRDGGQERQWGHSRNSGAIGIEREVVLHLYPDRIAIEKGPSANLPDGIGREEFHELVAAMIQTEANSWGEPPAKFVWRPRLKIEIHPGGNQHYSRLKELLKHWGLSSKVEQVLD